MEQPPTSTSFDNDNPGTLTLPWMAYFSSLTKFLSKPTVFALPFAATWANYNIAYSQASYYKDSNGRVFLSGFIAKTGVAVAGETIATLPVGFRPALIEGFPVMAGWAYGSVYVDAAGLVRYHDGLTTFLSLSSISFMAA
jgi:hypothetical protein